MFLLRFFIEETHDSESCEDSNSENNCKEWTEIGSAEIKKEKGVDNDGFFYEVTIEFHMIDFLDIFCIYYNTLFENDSLI